MRVQRRHRGVEGEEAVERETRTITRRGNGEATAQAGIGRIADWGSKREAIDPTAQDDDEKARIARAGDGGARQLAPQRQRRTARDEAAQKQRSVDATPKPRLYELTLVR